MDAEAAGRKHGWRSGLEKKFAEACRAKGVRFLYEKLTLPWEPEAKTRAYTPDFQVYTDSGTCLVIETKGRWTRADRLKLKRVLEQHPHLNLRIVFQNPKAKISKRSKTTYAHYAESIGLPWATMETWTRWLDE